MRELEVKILNMDLKELELKIIALGARLISKEVQVNTLIDSKDNFIENELDSYMRIRETRFTLKDKLKLTLTMKKNINRDGIRENIEINTDISDKEAMLKILDSLGYKVISEGEKERTSYELGDVRFDLDTWDKDTYPHPYMEIEVKDEDELEDVIKLLEIPRENISLKSILELKKEINN